MTTNYVQELRRIRKILDGSSTEFPEHIAELILDLRGGDLDDAEDVRALALSLMRRSAS